PTGLDRPIYQPLPDPEVAEVSQPHAERRLSRKLDLPAPAPRTRAHGPPDLRHHDAGGRLTAQLARLVDRLLERVLHAGGKFLQRLFQGRGLDLEAKRQHARGGAELRLPRAQHRPGGVRGGGKSRNASTNGRSASSRSSRPRLAGATHLSAGASSALGVPRYRSTIQSDSSTSRSP